MYLNSSLLPVLTRAMYLGSLPSRFVSRYVESEHA